MKIDTNLEKVEDILIRGTEDIFIREHLKEALLSGKQLRIKFGIDRQAPIFIWTSCATPQTQGLSRPWASSRVDYRRFTAKIADPSDKLEKRPMLSDEEIKENLKIILDK